MNCDEYIAHYLSADADDQLAEQERCLVNEHLRSCSECRARLDEELALKASIRHHIRTAKTPADVRLRIRAALGETAEHGALNAGIWARAEISSSKDVVRRPVVAFKRRRAAASANSRSETVIRAGSIRRWLALQVKRAQYLAPIGFVLIVLAALTAMFRISFKVLPGEPVAAYQKSIRPFDFAIGRFNELSREFAPNVPPEAFERDNGAYFAWVQDPLRHVSAELPDISVSYEKMQMPPEFCDFALVGYELAGGRIDHMPDGAPVTYTLYRNQTTSILSIGLKQRLIAPQGGYWFDSHVLYSYRGYSICLTIYPTGNFASIIVARAPMEELLRDVATSDVALLDR
jgi:hypothetical protein